MSRKELDPQGYVNLASYIRNNAKGVFLWVYLVVLEVLDGIENGDKISDLQRRLERLPTELKALFTHMLNSVDGHYHEKQAQTLLVASSQEQPLSLMTYYFLDEDDPDFALKCPILSMDLNEIRRCLRDMSKRILLDASCCQRSPMDILEIWISYILHALSLFSTEL